MTATVCKYNVALGEYCPACKDALFTIPARTAPTPSPRSAVIAGNFAAAARNEARAMTLELDNEALARLAVAKAMTAALRTICDEWGARGWLPVGDRLP